MPKPRVVVAPAEVAGYYSSLVEGFRSLGIACEFVEYSHHAFNYHATDSLSWMTRISRFLNTSRKKWGIFAGMPFHLAYWFVRLIHVLILILRNDSFVFGYGQSLLPHNLDLPILRLLGKRIVMVMGHGSEARPPYLDGPAYNDSIETAELMQQFRKEAIDRRARMRRAERYADVIVGSRLSTSHFASRPFVSWLQIGIPCRPFDKDLVLPTSSEKTPYGDSNDTQSRPIRILHSPSKPQIKGTERIRDAVSKLQQEGLKLEYVEIVNQPNSKVLEAISKCDFVVDQLYSDTPMAGFATEAACFGKPSIVGGYRLEQLRQFFAGELWPPSFVCQPDAIEQAIRELANNQALRESLGNQARSFVHQYWSADKVATRFLQLISGQFPQEWLVDPRTITYEYGCGLTEKQVKLNIQNLIEQYGVEALQLGHRPELEVAIVEFAKKN